MDLATGADSSFTVSKAGWCCARFLFAINDARMKNWRFTPQTVMNNGEKHFQIFSPAKFVEMTEEWASAKEEPRTRRAFRSHERRHLVCQSFFSTSKRGFPSPVDIRTRRSHHLSRVWGGETDVRWILLWNAKTKFGDFSLIAVSEENRQIIWNIRWKIYKNPSVQEFSTWLEVIR